MSIMNIYCVMKRLFGIRLWLTVAVFLLPLPLIGDVIFKDGFEYRIARLNDTGIDWGGDYPDGNNATCTGETITAQDCSNGRDVTHDDDSDGHAGFSFTKLDANGNTLPVSASVWDCVRDKVTGLTWEVKKDDGGLRDTDNTYTWYNPDSSTNGGNPGTQNGGFCTGSDCDTYNYVQAVNAATQALCGNRDWRMPWREELRSIVDHSRVNPSIDRVYFPNQVGSYVWSGSPDADSSDNAWLVYFLIGNDSASARNIADRVRLVRGRQAAASAGAQQGCSSVIPQSTPTADFNSHGDGTVTHNPTGLMWKKCVEGLGGADCATGTASDYTWQEALQLANGHSFAGYNDWQLPNIKELASIVELSCFEPAINRSVFPNDPGSHVWSGSPYAGYSKVAWGDNFRNGSDSNDDRTNLNRVRLVRDPQ